MPRRPNLSASAENPERSAIITAAEKRSACGPRADRLGAIRCRTMSGTNAVRSTPLPRWALPVIPQTLTGTTLGQVSMYAFQIPAA